MDRQPIYSVTNQMYSVFVDGTSSDVCVIKSLVADVAKGCLNLPSQQLVTLTTAAVQAMGQVARYMVQEGHAGQILVEAYATEFAVTVGISSPVADDACPDLCDVSAGDRVFDFAPSPYVICLASVPVRHVTRMSQRSGRVRADEEIEIELPSNLLVLA